MNASLSRLAGWSAFLKVLVIAVETGLVLLLAALYQQATLVKFVFSSAARTIPCSLSAESWR